MTYEEIVRFHGHECPGLAIGYKMATAAMERLESLRAEDEELVAIVENDACGENVMESRIRKLAGKPACIPCYEEQWKK